MADAARNPQEVQAKIAAIQAEIAALQAKAAQGDPAATTRIAVLTAQLGPLQQQYAALMPGDRAERQEIAEGVHQGDPAAIAAERAEAERTGNYTPGETPWEYVPGIGPFVAPGGKGGIQNSPAGKALADAAGKHPVVQLAGGVKDALPGIKDALGYGNIDASGLNTPATRAEEMRQQLLKERGEAGYTPQQVTDERAGYVDPGAAQMVQGPDSVKFNPVAAAQINTAQGDAVRGDMLGVAREISAAARGEGPFVADEAWKGKQADIERAVHAKAATARGSDRSYARLNATSEMADQLRRAAMDSGAQKAQEIATARGQAVGALSDIRGTDVNQATQQAGLNQQAGLEGQRLGVGVDVGNRDAAQRAREINAAATNSRASEQAAGQTQNNQYNAGQGNQVSAQNQQAGLQGAQLDVRRKEGLADGAFKGNDQNLEAEMAKIGVARGNQQNKREFYGNALDITTKVLGSSLSDERTKTDVEPVGDAAAAKLAKALEPVQFKYKGEHNDGNDHAGFMAQDLEKDPLGKKFVSQRPDGLKQVDYGQLASVLLAAALKSKKEARG